MTPDERNMLTDLANKIAQTPAPQHDAEAEDFVRTRIGSRPDALYLMTQTVLIQNLALQHAQQQIQELQQRSAPSAAPGGSFLGRQTSVPNAAPAAPAYQQPSGYAQQPNYAPPQYAAPTPTPAPGGTGSFLKGAAQTAAGVAAGALAFEGIESLFHGMGGGGMGGGFGGFGGGGGYNHPGSETVINNYYDSPQGLDERGGERFDSGDRLDNRDDYQAAGLSDDVNDTSGGDDAGQFEDSVDDAGVDDSSSGDSYA